MIRRWRLAWHGRFAARSYFLPALCLLALLLPMLLAVSAIALYETFQFSSMLDTQLKLFAETLEKQHALASAHQGDREEPSDQALGILPGLRVSPHLVYAALYDAEGAMQAAYLRPNADADFSPLSRQPKGKYSTKDYWHFFTNVEIGPGKKADTLYLCAEKAALYRRLWGYGGMVIGLLPLSLILAWGLHRVARRHFGHVFRQDHRETPLELQRTCRELEALREVLRTPPTHNNPFRSR